jgi:hypothetical protein
VGSGANPPRQRYAQRMTEIVALGSTVCIGTMRSGEREGSMACCRQISHSGIAWPKVPHRPTLPVYGGTALRGSKVVGQQSSPGEPHVGTNLDREDSNY